MSKKLSKLESIFGTNGKTTLNKIAFIEKVKELYDNYKLNKRINKLERSEIACLMNFQDGTWEMNDMIAVKMYKGIKKELRLLKRNETLKTLT